MVDQAAMGNPVMEKYGDMPSRRLNFSGASNFRDLGGYETVDGRKVRWELLFRSDSLHRLSVSDLRYLSALTLDRIIDFRAEHEKKEQPDQLPMEMAGRVVEIPILDSSTKIWHDSREELVKNLKSIDPAQYMLKTNIELATRFSPEIRRFIGELISANGQPVLFHCAAGKDRTGFAAAILLRILGVPHEIVLQDYLLTNRYFLPRHQRGLVLLRLWKGRAAAAAVSGFMEARPEYLTAAFGAIYREFGSFEEYVFKSLDLTMHDTERLRDLYLE